jgi:intracellular sulfur oxidation DsrE/DsrF family protein
MNRRTILATILAAVGTPLALSARAGATERDGPKATYHLNDLDKVDFVLGNIENHFAGMGGPDKVTIALVVHGPALRAFHQKGARRDVAQRLARLSGAGFAAHACSNTMRAQHIGLTDLLPGFAAADKGAVVLLAELQSQGYAYLKP